MFKVVPCICCKCSCNAAWVRTSLGESVGFCDKDAIIEQSFATPNDHKKFTWVNLKQPIQDEEEDKV